MNEKERLKKNRKQTADLIESLPDDAIVHARFSIGDEIDAEELRIEDLKFFAGRYLAQVNAGSRGGAPAGNKNALGNPGNPHPTGKKKAAE